MHEEVQTEMGAEQPYVLQPSSRGRQAMSRDGYPARGEVYTPTSSRQESRDAAEHPAVPWTPPPHKELVRGRAWLPPRRTQVWGSEAAAGRSAHVGKHRLVKMGLL